MKLWKILLCLDLAFCLNILTLAHDKVVVVILSFMDKNNCKPLPEDFLKSWNGNSVDGVESKFTKAEGSSLTSTQQKMLTRNIPVVRPKEKELLKIFVSGPNSTIYSTIISRKDLKLLSKAFSEHGVKFSSSDMKTYGI